LIFKGETMTAFYTRVSAFFSRLAAYLDAAGRAAGDTAVRRHSQGRVFFTE
jgi:hypothetical protein